MYFLVLLAIVPVCIQTTMAHQQCYANKKDHYMYFGAVTAYERVYNRTQDKVVIDHCEPKQFWLIGREGTSYPNYGAIENFQALPSLRNKILENMKKWRSEDSLCDEDLKNLEEWTPLVTSTLADNLTPQGYRDIRNLARRFKSRFPTLLDKKYRRDLFEFQFSAAQRTMTSAFAFAEGLFGSTYKEYLPDPPSVNRLLTPFLNCHKWFDEMPDSLKEMFAFYNTTEMDQLVQKVSRRLGFNTTLYADDINIMYDCCRHDAAFHTKEISPWCAVFTEEEAKIMEYRDDLIHYYYAGYGKKLNGKLACPPIRDFLDRFSLIEKGLPQPAGVFYFTHLELMEMILIPLGIAKDSVPLTHTNYKEMSDRKWRTSFISPFAINLAVVFYKCDQGEQYRVQFYHGETLLNFEGCNQGVCDWTYIKEKLSKISKPCHFHYCY